MLTCCSLPRVSVNRRSAHFTSFSLISFTTSLELMSPPVRRGQAHLSPTSFFAHQSRISACTSELVHGLEPALIGLMHQLYATHGVRIVVASFHTEFEVLGGVVTEGQRDFLQFLVGAASQRYRVEV